MRERGLALICAPSSRNDITSGRKREGWKKLGRSVVGGVNGDDDEGGVRALESGVASRLTAPRRSVTVTGHTCTHVGFHAWARTYTQRRRSLSPLGFKTHTHKKRTLTTISVNKISVSSSGSLCFIIVFPSVHLCYITTATQA